MQGARFKFGHPLTLLIAAGSSVAPAVVLAADAHQAVKPEPGEIVLLRDVSARQAIRSAPPGMALIMDPSPKREIDMMLGTGELSDAEYASLGAGAADAQSRTTVELMIGRAVGGSLTGTASGNGTLAAGGIVQPIGVSTGGVGGATRGFADQVNGALSQFPMVSPPGNPPPGG